MEIFLLVALLIVLLLCFNALNTKFDDNAKHITKLTNAVVLLKQQLEKGIVTTPKTETKTTISDDSIVVTVPPPIITQPPITPTTTVVNNTLPPIVTEPYVSTFKQPEPTTNTPNEVTPTATPVATPTPPPARKPYVAPPRQKTYWEKFKEKNPDLEKFIGEDLISKIGILILVLGVSYFVKYSIDKGWINEPARVGIGVLCGAAIMALAHRLRAQYTAFSSVLVAGAIAIFYFTIGIAFHSYHLIGQNIAFALMTVITIFSCLVSLSYNRKELAVLSLIGGFAVPFMVSTGSGNYQALFTYILILNTGILVMAYMRSWTILNILSYVFTVVLYGAWLLKTMHPNSAPPYLGALLFGFAFYMLFIIMNVINAIRNKGALAISELSILASSTFLFYGAGMFILNYYQPEFKGLFTTLLGVLNFINAYILYKKFGVDKTTVYLLIGFTLTFVTLAIPIQFNGNYITLFWAAEAVILMWLGQKSNYTMYRLGSILVTAFTGISLVMDWGNVYNSATMVSIVLNPAFVTGAFVLVALGALIYIIKNDTFEINEYGIKVNSKEYSSFLTIVLVSIAYIVGMLEVVQQSYSYIAYYYSASALPLTYHMLFSVALFVVCNKRQDKLTKQLLALLAIVNILLYVVLINNLPYMEHTIYMGTGTYVRLAFYLHYVLLGITLYFGYKLYHYNKTTNVLGNANSPVIVWPMAVLLVFIASSELLLHSLVITNVPITDAVLKASKEFNQYNVYNNLSGLRAELAQQNIEHTSAITVKSGFPILWGLIAFVFLILGIKRQNKTLRIIALSLLGLTIVKLFVYDIRNVSETGKIIAFILLGVLILIISFVYQKIKVLVTDATPTAPTSIDTNTDNNTSTQN
jgi:uncharacterized membrane protein